MQISCRLWSIGLVLLAAGPVIGAEPLPWPDDAAPAESALKKSAQLIREEAGRAVAPREPVRDLLPADKSENVVVLDKLVVREKRTPAIPPAVHETPVDKFFRTGTIAEHIGKKVTTKFWFSGERGLMLSFLW
jgi:hypothetical protein